MELDLLIYKIYSRNVILFLISSGLWPDTNPIVKKIISIITLFSSFTVAFTVAHFCFQNITNVILLTKGMGLAISYTSAFLKVAIFLLHQDDLAYLNTYITTRYMSNLQNREDWPDLLHNIKAFITILYIYVITAGVSTAIYGIRPLLILKKYGRYVLQFPGIFPFSYEPGGIVHWFLYCVELAAGLTLFGVTIAVDCVFGLYSLQICGELRILAKRFNDLHVAKDYKDNFKDCIVRYQVMITAKNKLEDLMGFISIWIAISGALVLCSLLFQVSEILKNHGNPVSLVPICVYLIPKFLQIFTYAWYGNIIAEESKVCLNSMYNSHWSENCDSRFKNDILIVLAQEPLILKAKGCMFIQLDMFTKIVKTSVSYFCLLQTLNESSE